MRVAIAKWGNSLALRLPKHAVEEAKLKEGAAVEVEVRDGMLVIRPARPRYKLSDLLADYKKKHRHEEVDWGARRGKEEW